MADANFILALLPDTTVTGTATNATATATIAAPQATQCLYLCGVSLSASGQPAAPVTATLVDDGATNRGTWQLPAAAFVPVEIGFSRPRKIAPGRGVTLTLPALGAGITGTAQIHYKIGGA